MHGRFGRTKPFPLKDSQDEQKLTERSFGFSASTRNVRDERLQSVAQALLFNFMKSILRKIGLFFAFGFALAAALQFIDFVTLPGISTGALVAGLAVSCVFTFMLVDYSRKPAFRVRRTDMDAGPTVNRPPGPGPDWTYTTRSK
jgi:hypothetical protein